MKTAYLVGDVREIGVAMANLKKDALYLCATESALEECRRRRLNCVLIDETPLEPEFRQMNDWAYGVTLDLISRFGKGEKADYLDSQFMDLKAVILQAMKYLFCLKKHLDGISVLCVFDSEHKLAVELCGEAVRSGYPSLRVEEVSLKRPAQNGGWKGIVRRVLGAAMEIQSSLAIRSLGQSKRPVVIISGAMNHLAPVVESLKRLGGIEFVWCETSYNREKSDYCRKTGISFVTAPPKNVKAPFDGSDIFFASGTALYEGLDVSRLLDFAVRKGLEVGAIRPGFDARRVRRIIESPGVKAVLLDEDFASRRLFAVSARRAGVESFVVSHGVPGILLGRLPMLKGRYLSSTTFVNSEFEKLAYEELYYDSSKIVVTGVPRYDRIAELNRQAPTPRRKKNILYCASMLVDYDFRRLFTVLGCKDFLGDYTKRYLDDLLEIVSRRRDSKLVIKPHYNDETVCHRRVSASAAKASYEIVSHRRTIFELERDADVIVTPESSVICEAVMFGKPVIVLSYGVPLAMPYQETGLVLCVKNRHELEAALCTALDDRVYREKLDRTRAATLARFAGPFDEKNTERVTESIWKKCA